jgi:hypothetical protein
MTLKQQSGSIISKDDLIKLLPHGSGIDCSWEITLHRDGNVTAKNYYHAMNENGMYDGYMPFTVKIFRVKETRVNKLKGPCAGKYQIVAMKGDIDVKITCNESRKASFYGLKEYLEQTISFSLESIITPVRQETLTKKEVEQWLK